MAEPPTSSTPGATQPEQRVAVTRLGSSADRPPRAVPPTKATPGTPAVRPATPAPPAAEPVEILADRLGLRAPLLPLRLTAAGALAVPKRYDEAGWWRDGPRPGEPGASVLVGHVDSRRGPAVFHPLLRAEIGDRITVRRADGSTATFVVYRVSAYRKSAFPTAAVYGATAGPELRLVTCSGPFDEGTGHYLDNLVVFARAA